MPSNILKRLIACVLCLVIMTSLCACSPYIDEDFLNLNLHAQEKPTEPPTEETTPSTPPTDETQPPEESKPAFKPGGFTLNEQEETQPPQTEPIDETQPDTNEDDTTPKPSQPTQPKPPSGGQVGNVKVSAGLKSALNSIGRTSVTGDQVTAFHPNTGVDGGITIFRIVNQSTKTAKQTTYTYYESQSDFEAAIAGLSEDAYNSGLRLITRSVAEVLPVTDPDTMGIVLFDGYLLWR